MPHGSDAHLKHLDGLLDQESPAHEMLCDITAQLVHDACVQASRLGQMAGSHGSIEMKIDNAKHWLHTNIALTSGALDFMAQKMNATYEAEINHRKNESTVQFKPRR